MVFLLLTPMKTRVIREMHLNNRNPPRIRIPRAPSAIVLAPHAPLVAAHIVAIEVMVRIPHIVAAGIGIKDVPRIRVSAAAGNNVVEEPAVEIKVGLDGGIERQERAN
ncbi:hypothetical protein V494_06087 [Pseudogymnoascus sp. VKM F-4513 (FW-928)]|nr:hypothetical protein V494_06087 [Pseudogymnoascus sp. VKM F-4513 (FW-928)]